MTQEERFKITSNDYFDLMINYNGNEALLTQYQNYSVQIMNESIAVIYVPVAEISNRTIAVYGYSAIPTCYGLTADRSLEASGVERIRRLPSFNLRGRGVLIGVVDTGIDYTNPVFQNADGTTRIISIWDQTVDSENAYPVNTFYGTEYNSDQLNQALQNQNPFDIVPSNDEIGHGTMMSGVAAGSEADASNFSGVVPDSEIIAVKLKPAKQNLRDYFKIPADTYCYQENDLMWGVQYLVAKARELRRPISICIGVGSSQGSHDGYGALSSLLGVVGDFIGVTVTIAGGNEGNTRRHFYSTVNPSEGMSAVELNVGENEMDFSMEIWGEAPNTYSIDILSPSGEYIPRIAEGLEVSRTVTFVFETTQIDIFYEMVESQSGDQLILMRFQKPSPGTWRFQVYGRGDLQGSFHVWLPMNNFLSDQTYFVQSNPYTTITSPGNSRVPITVTGYNPNNDALYLGAGKGYSRINVVKPDLAAPGVNILSPNLAHGFSQVTGTSVAAAHTAGICAMVLEWGTVLGHYPGIDTVEVKKFLIRGARRSETQQYPNRDWGYGNLDIYNVFDILRSSSGVR